MKTGPENVTKVNVKKLRAQGSESLYLAILILSIAVLLLLSGYFIRNRKNYDKMSLCYGTCQNQKCIKSASNR